MQTYSFIYCGFFVHLELTKGSLFLLDLFCNLNEGILSTFYKKNRSLAYIFIFLKVNSTWEKKMRIYEKYNILIVKYLKYSNVNMFIF